MAICYIISPLKHSVFNMLHTVSHYVEDRMHSHKNTTVLTNVHNHDAFGKHITSKTPPLANHTHSSTGKVIPNHTHNLLAVLNDILSSTDKQKEHQKSIYKTEIDKHVLTSEFNFKSIEFSTVSKHTWYTYLHLYTINLPTLSPPPQYIS
ncbi:hypothetical protein AST99_07275 [Formosa algae]|nr:hypothetical protein AST99_07275 [Formosa algae]